MSVYVFDLDQTVVDSSHRTPIVNGKVDVSGYMQLQTRDNIYKDSILPIGKIMKEKYKSDYVVVCTARLMTDTDYEFLQDNELFYHEIYERGNVDKSISALNDGEYKMKCLKKFKNTPYTFYDDSDEVINKFSSYDNVRMIDSRTINM